MPEETNPTPEDKTQIDPFAESKEGGQPTVPSVPSDPMSDWVGEGKKYASAEEAVKALAHSQNHIAKLEAENQSFRDQMAQAQQQQSVKDMIAEAIREQQSVTTTPVVPTETPAPAGITPEEVQKLVRESMEQNSREAQMRSNLQMVNDELIKIHGSKANAVTASAAAEAGMSISQFKELAMTHPQVVLKMMTASGGVNNPATPDNATLTSNSLPSGSDLHGLPKAHSIVPPSGEYKPSPLRNSNRQQLMDEWKKSYPAEAVEAMKKQGQL